MNTSYLLELLFTYNVMQAALSPFLVKGKWAGYYC